VVVNGGPMDGILGLGCTLVAFNIQYFGNGQWSFKFHGHVFVAFDMTYND